MISMNASSSSVDQAATGGGYSTGLLDSYLGAGDLAPSYHFDDSSLPGIGLRCSNKFHFGSRRRNNKKNCSLGSLDTLPPEIRNQVFLELDVASLIVIRGMSRTTRLAVDALAEYKTIQAQVPELDLKQ